MKTRFHSSPLEMLAEFIIASLIGCTLISAIFDTCSNVAHAQNLASQNASSPAPAYAMTQAEYNATVLHRDSLIQQRNKELEKQLADLKSADASLSANVAANTDLRRQVKAQDSEISVLKLSRWKYAIISVLISVPLGILLAVGSFLAVKAGWAGAQAATKLAAIAVKA